MIIILKINKSFILILTSVLFLGLLTPMDVSLANETGSDIYQEETLLEVDFKEKELELIEKERDGFVDELKEIISSEENTNIDDVVFDALEEVPQKTFSDAMETEIEKKSVEGINESVGLDTNTPIETYEVSENLTVTIENNLIIVDEYEESEELDVSETFNWDESDESDVNETSMSPFKFINYFTIDKASAATKSKIKKASYTRHIYDTMFKKWKVLTMYISAEFTYNGKKVTARRTGNYFKANGIVSTFVNFSKKSSAVQKPSSKRRVAYQSGSGKVGVKIKGHALSIQSFYGRIDLESNHNGKITKSAMFK